MKAQRPHRSACIKKKKKSVGYINIYSKRIREDGQRESTSSSSKDSNKAQYTSESRKRKMAPKQNMRAMAIKGMKKKKGVFHALSHYLCKYLSSPNKPMMDFGL